MALHPFCGRSPIPFVRQTPAVTARGDRRRRPSASCSRPTSRSSHSLARSGSNGSTARSVPSCRRSSRLSSRVGGRRTASRECAAQIARPTTSSHSPARRGASVLRTSRSERCSSPRAQGGSPRPRSPRPVRLHDPPPSSRDVSPGAKTSRPRPSAAASAPLSGARTASRQGRGDPDVAVLQPASGSAVWDPKRGWQSDNGHGIDEGGGRVEGRRGP